MIDMSAIFRKALQDSRKNEKYGIRYTTDLINGVPESYVDKALDRLDLEEREKLIYLQNEGVSIEIIRSGGGDHGFWRQSDKLVGLAVSPRGRFNRGTIIHEATHYEQWKEGRLSTTESDSRLWEGERVKNAERNIDYFRLPWEQEAFRAEAEFLGSKGLRIPASIRMWWWEKGYLINPCMEKLSKSLLFPLLFLLVCQSLLLAVTWPFSETLASVTVTLFTVSPIGIRIMKVQIERLKEKLSPREASVLRGATPRKK